MSAETSAQLAQGNGISITLTDRMTSFDAIAKELGRRLVIDKGIFGPRGCAPCHSGLDFIIIGKEKVINPVIPQLQQRR
jgi:hypothetical protein